MEMNFGCQTNYVFEIRVGDDENDVVIGEIESMLFPRDEGKSQWQHSEPNVQIFWVRYKVLKRIADKGHGWWVLYKFYRLSSN